MRRNSFDALRLVAAGLVLYAHSFAVPGFPQPKIFGGTLGGFGVWIFFATSGYLVMASWKREPNIVAYTWKRSLRILPALVPLGLGLALVAHFGLFEQNPRHELNTSLWSLPIEARCYVLIAVLGIAGALRRPTAVLSIYVALVLLLTWHESPFDILSGGHVGAWSAFAGGMLMHWVPRSGVIAAACGLALTTLPLYVDRFPHVDVVWALTVPYLVIYAAERFAVRLPHDLSYGLYIWGWPVQQAIVAVGITAPLAIFPVALTATALLAFASWSLVERPALRLKAWRPRVYDRAHAY